MHQSDQLRREVLGNSRSAVEAALGRLQLAHARAAAELLSQDTVENQLACRGTGRAVQNLQNERALILHAMDPANAEVGIAATETDHPAIVQIPQLNGYIREPEQ